MVLGIESLLFIRKAAYQDRSTDHEEGGSGYGYSNDEVQQWLFYLFPCIAALIPCNSSFKLFLSQHRQCRIWLFWIPLRLSCAYDIFLFSFLPFFLQFFNNFLDSKCISFFYYLFCIFLLWFTSSITRKLLLNKCYKLKQSLEDVYTHWIDQNSQNFLWW